jgi:hypothetical protein
MAAIVSGSGRSWRTHTLPSVFQLGVDREVELARAQRRRRAVQVADTWRAGFSRELGRSWGRP